jgi:tetratricopeptide (TPR) repeat protein
MMTTKKTRLSGSARALASLGCALFLTLWTAPAPAHPNHAPAASSGSSSPADEAARLEKSIGLSRQRLEERPGDTVALSSLGALYLQKGRLTGRHEDFRAAAEYLEELLKVNPKSVNAHFGLAQALSGRHLFREALEHARAASALKPLDKDVKILAGDCLFYLGDYDEAEKYYAEYLDDNDLTVEALARAAQMAEVRGQDAKALSLWRDARECGMLLRVDDKTIAWVETMLGDFFLDRGRPGAAEGHYRAALGLEPGNSYADWRLARVAADQGRWQEAHDALVKVEPRRGRPEVWLDLARANAQLGHPEEAASWRQKAEDDILGALEKEGELGHVRYLVEYWIETGKNLDRAIELARRDLEARGDFGAEETLAWALHRAGKTAEAVPHIEKALAPGVRLPRVLKRAAEIFDAAGLPDRAQEARQREQETFLALSVASAPE